MHEPDEHAAVALVGVGHVVGVYPRPSELQTRLVIASAQSAAPGVQTHGLHAPERQLDRAPQGRAVYESPSALQVRAVEASAQLTAAGVQTRDWHVPPEQLVPDAQVCVV